MRLLAVVAAVFMTLAFAACGGDGDETTTSALDAKIEEYLKGPNPEPPPGPPPKELTVEDLKVGTGPVAKHGDQVAVHYIAEGYESGSTYSRRWEPDPPAIYPRLGEGPYDELEEGIEGMKEGGRREIIVPKYGQFPIIYVLELEKVVPASKSSSQGG